MDTLSYKTISANSATANKEWFVVDAAGETLGRLAARVAIVLRGKHKPNFTPHADCGDNVVVINAEKVQMTGKKWADKVYISHSGYPGGQKTVTAEQMMAKDPRRFIEYAVRGMLPKNRLGRQLFNNMNVYVGGKHPHEAQAPKNLDLNTIK